MCKIMKNILVIVAFLVLGLVSTANSKSIFPKTLYVYWNQDIEKAPFLIKICIENLRMVCKASSWNFTLLTNQNLPEHLPDYHTKYLPARTNIKHPAWQAYIADLVRLAIIEQKGGMYLDLSTILFRGLQWVEKLQNYEYLLTNSQLYKGQEPDALIPYEYQYQSTSQSRDPDHGMTNLEPGYGLWCLLGKANSTFIKEYRDLHIHHYLHTRDENEIEDVNNDQFFRGIYGDYLDVQRTVYELIQQKQFQLDKNLTLLGHRINVNHFYKVVGFRAEYGPFLFHYLNPFKIFTHTLEQIYEEDYMPLFFFVKLTHYDRPYVEYLFNHQIELAKIYGNITQNFAVFMSSKPSIDDCQNIKFIVEGSIVGELIRGNKVAIQNKMGAISVQQRKQWRDYCNNNFGIIPDSIDQISGESANLLSQDSPALQPDKKIMLILEQILGFFSFFLTQNKINQIRSLLTQIATYCFYAGRFYYGRPSGIQQTYYWRKVFQSRHPNIANPTPNPDAQFAPTQSLDKYSIIEILKLRVKLFFIANKSTLAFQVKVFILFIFLTLKVALAFFIVTLVLKFIFIFIFKSTQKFTSDQNHQNQSFAKKIAHVLASKFYKNCSKIKNFCMKLKNSDFNQKFTILSSFFFTLSKYAFKKTLILILCLIFIAYNALILSKYYFVVFLGKIYDQELQMIMFIVLQIGFKYIFKKIGSNTWWFPGVSLEELQKIFSPFYIFCIGSSILIIAERTEVRNLSLGVSLCMILPVLISKFQIKLNQLNKDFKLKKKLSKIQQPVFKKFTNFCLVFLLNLSSSIESMVLLFLGFCIIFPNFRFIVYNNEDYLVKKIAHSMEMLLAFFLIILVILTLVDFYQKIVAIRKDKSKKLSDQSSNNQTTQKSLKSDRSEDDFGFNKQESSSFASKFSHLKRFIMTKKQLLGVVCLGLYSSFKIWIYYKLVSTQWSQILIRNTIKVRYQQQFRHLDDFDTALYIMKMLFIFFVSFELQSMLEKKLFMRQPQKMKGTQGIESQKNANKQQKQFQQNTFLNLEPQDTTNSNIVLSCLLWIQFYVLLVTQFIIFDKIVSYLTAIDTDNQDKKKQLEGHFQAVSSIAALILVFSFKIVKQVAVHFKKIERHQIFFDSTDSENVDSYLLKEKQHQENLNSSPPSENTSASTQFQKHQVNQEMASLNG